MKKITNITGIILFIVISFYSCKSKDEIDQDKLRGIYLADSIKNAVPHFGNTPDTSIGQQVWYNKKGGKYVLQTWVNTNKYQAHYSNNREDEMRAWVGDMPKGAPYNVDIIGSFEYIKANKAIEYRKAVKVLDSLRVQGYAIQIKQSLEDFRQKAINDTIKILQNLK